MFAIHPNQVQTINECFSPSAQEIEYAKKVVAAYEEAERYADLVQCVRCVLCACSHTVSVINATAGRARVPRQSTARWWTRLW
jgi:succinate dehydrogenase/fumarate reductase-like Fe-S protein